MQLHVARIIPKLVILSEAKDLLFWQRNAQKHKWRAAARH